MGNNISDYVILAMLTIGMFITAIGIGDLLNSSKVSFTLVGVGLIVLATVFHKLKKEKN